MGRREIGLKSPSYFGDEILGNGMTNAVLKLFRKVSSYKHLLNSFGKVGVKILLASFTNLAGISSGSCQNKA